MGKQFLDRTFVSLVSLVVQLFLAAASAQAQPYPARAARLIAKWAKVIKFAGVKGL